MPTIKNIRFQKLDQFENAIFIADKKREPDTYQQLNGYYKQLKESTPEIFLPIYSNQEHNYSTIRVNSPMKYETNATYSIKFSIRKVIKGEKTYINVNIDRIKFLKPAPVIDLGTEILLE